MKNILVLSYAVSPYRGSEYSVAWNYITHMSSIHNLTILYGTAGEHMGDFEEMSIFLEENQVPNTIFIPIKPNKRARIVNSLNKRKILRYSFYIAYRFWQKQAYIEAQRIIKINHIDIVHFLNPIGYREPGYLWKLNCPYIWGPIGGSSNVPISLFSPLDFQSKIKFFFRNTINTLQLKLSLRLPKAIKSTNVLIAATKEDQSRFNIHYRTNCIYLPENGIIKPPSEIIASKSHSKIILTWIGRIDAAKSLIILLKALTLLPHLKDKYYLNIVGDGPLKTKLMDFSNKHGLNNIKWHGKVDRETVFNILINSDLHVMTSIKEANSTVLFEAMEAGIPTVSLKIGGMQDIICPQCGLLINIGSYSETIKIYSKILNEHINNPLLIEDLKKGVQICAKKYTWDKRNEFWNKTYLIAEARWKTQNQ